MIFAPSPRRIGWNDAEEIAKRVDDRIAAVAVFVNPRREDVGRVRDMFPSTVVQLSGEETPEFAASLGGRIVKTFHVGSESPAELDAMCARYPCALPLFDTKSMGMYGGTGLTFEWARIADLARRRNVVIAGGLCASNVGVLVRIVRPYGVDVRSGIETDGRKDVQKMRAFVRAVRDNDAPR